MSMNEVLGNAIARNLSNDLEELNCVKFIKTPRENEYIFDTNIGNLKYIYNGFGTLHIFNVETNEYELYHANIDLELNNLLRD